MTLHTKMVISHKPKLNNKGDPVCLLRLLINDKCMDSVFFFFLNFVSWTNIRSNKWSFFVVFFGKVTVGLLQAIKNIVSVELLFTKAWLLSRQMGLGPWQKHSLSYPFFLNYYLIELFFATRKLLKTLVVKLKNENNEIEKHIEPNAKCRCATCNADLV